MNATELTALIDEAQRALIGNPANVEARTVLADAYTDAEQPWYAEIHRRLLAARPLDRPEVRPLLAQALEADGQPLDDDAATPQHRVTEHSDAIFIAAVIGGESLVIDAFWNRCLLVWTVRTEWPEREQKETPSSLVWCENGPVVTADLEDMLG
jgi:hypothetical protein